MQKYLDLLESHRDFPKPGINFYDISRLLRLAFPDIMRQLATELGPKIALKDKVIFAGVESRGFILAAGLAATMGRGCTMIRKRGKLPGITVHGEVSLEYGLAELESHYGTGRIILCDDVVATGGTLLGAEKLLTRAGYDVIAKVCLLNLGHLNTIADDELISLLKVWS